MGLPAWTAEASRTMPDNEHDRTLYVLMGTALGLTALMVVIGMLVVHGGGTSSSIADGMWTAVMAAYPGGSVTCHAVVMDRAFDIHDMLGDGPHADDVPFGRTDYRHGELAVRMVAEAEWQPPECAGGD